jgi:RNA polymerase sigma factor (sigma-70 family)
MNQISITKEDCEMEDKKKYYIPIEGKLIEVEENVYIAYYKMGRRERYLEERDQDCCVLSYDAMDRDGMVGQEMFYNPATPSLEDLAIAKELLDQLHRCIDMLPQAERELIKAIYFDGMTDTDYSKKVKRSQQIVSYNHKRILSKMKKLMMFLTSF